METTPSPEITVTETNSTINPLVGVADGTVLNTGDKVVYEYDTDGTFIGWHKENA